MAKEIERTGIPVAYVTTLTSLAEEIRANRIVAGVRIPHPVGNPALTGDNDDAGRRHAEKVAASLHGVAKRVRVLDLSQVWPECSEKGDVRVRFKTSSRITELSQHETNGREFQECDGVSVEIFPVLGEAAATPFA